eukprot:1177427-Prorocentrum_minimum.AAC.3
MVKYTVSVSSSSLQGLVMRDGARRRACSGKALRPRWFFGWVFRRSSPSAPSVWWTRSTRAWTPSTSARRASPPSPPPPLAGFVSVVRASRISRISGTRKYTVPTDQSLVLYQGYIRQKNALGAPLAFLAASVLSGEARRFCCAARDVPPDCRFEPRGVYVAVRSRAQRPERHSLCRRAGPSLPSRANGHCA